MRAVVAGIMVALTAGGCSGSTDTPAKPAANATAASAAAGRPSSGGDSAHIETSTGVTADYTLRSITQLSGAFTFVYQGSSQGDTLVLLPNPVVKGPGTFQTASDTTITFSAVSKRLVATDNTGACTIELSAISTTAAKGTITCTGMKAFGTSGATTMDLHATLS